MRLTAEQSWDRLRQAERAVLCTTNALGAVDVVPVCFAVAGERVATAIDRVKPKRTTELGRRTNLERDARATILADHWDRDDWSRLWWVRATLVWHPERELDAGLLQECDAALRAKYVQYRTTEFAELMVFDVTQLLGWSGSGSGSAVPDGTRSARPERSW